MAKKSNTSKASIGMQLIDAEGLIKQLEALGHAVRDTVAREAIEAAMVPVHAAIQANTPESIGSRDKQSTKTKQKWSKSKKLKTTIRSVYRVRKRAGITAGALGLVGPSYSDGGGHGNLFAKDHKRMVLWGRDGGAVRVVNQFVKLAADQSRGQAAAALTQAVQSGIARAAKATTNG
jgi:hypothetical protein